MAVRFDASGESYSRTLGLGSVSAFTVSMWVRLASNRALSTILWQIDSGTNDWLTVRAWDGTSLAIETDGEWNALLGHTLTVGTWCYIGVGAQTSGAVNTVIGNAGGSLTSGNSNFGATTFTAGTLRIGVGGSPTGWLDGSEAAVKVWSGVQLTTDELELEAWTYLPRRTSNLTAWYPLLAPSTVDYSGNGQTLSGGAGATIDDGPPISWRSRRHRTILPAPVGLTASIAGTLPAATASTAATVKAAGSLAGTLPSPTAAASGTVTVAGSLAGVAPNPTAAFAGQSAGNVLAGILPAATASMAATVEVSATAAGLLPAAAGSFTAEIEIPANDITVTPGPVVRGWQAGVVDDRLDTAQLARAWSSTAASRGWDTDDAEHNWTAGTPTT